MTGRPTFCGASSPYTRLPHKFLFRPLIRCRRVTTGALIIAVLRGVRPGSAGLGRVRLEIFHYSLRVRGRKPIGDAMGNRKRGRSTPSSRASRRGEPTTPHSFERNPSRRGSLHGSRPRSAASSMARPHASQGVKTSKRGGRERAEVYLTSLRCPMIMIRDAPSCGDSTLPVPRKPRVVVSCPLKRCLVAPSAATDSLIGNTDEPERTCMVTSSVRTRLRRPDLGMSFPLFLHG